MALHRPLQSPSHNQLLSGLADVAGQSCRVESSLVAHIAEVDFRRLSSCILGLMFLPSCGSFRSGRAFRHESSSRPSCSQDQLRSARLRPPSSASNCSRGQCWTPRLRRFRPRLLVPSLPRSRSSSRFRRTAIKSSSPPGRNSTRTSSGFGPSCAQRYPTATSARSSGRQSGSCGSAWRRGDSHRRVPPGRPGCVRAARPSRYVTAEVRRAVYRRDLSQCRFTDAQGRRCPERHHLEYHHRYPFALGGGRGIDNICLMCPAHTRYLAELDLGAKLMSRHLDRREEARTASAQGNIGPTVPGTSESPNDREG
jgi:hypothetical protein